jgi:Tol biopolymer transport system component
VSCLSPRGSGPRTALEPEGTGLTNLTRSNPDGPDILPTVSPDGARIAFLRRTAGPLDLVVMSADGSDPQLLASDVRPLRPTWSRDGREVAFVACCENGRTNIYTIGVERDARRRVAEGSSSIAWSPDGARIAYVGLRVGNPAVFVDDRTGGSPRALAEAPATDTVAWSPDSARLAYDVAGTASPQYAVAVAEVDGGLFTRAVDGLPRPGRPAWSCSTSRLAFSDGDIRTIASDFAGTSELVAGGAGIQTDPRWSPGGDRLVFVTEIERSSFPAVGSYLEVVNPDGSGRARITPESPPAVQTVIQAARIAPPDRLSIASVRVSPGAFRRGGDVTARVVVESVLTGNPVDGANVSVSAYPPVVRVLGRPARARNGRAAIRLRLVRLPRARRVVTLAFVARRQGDVGGAVTSEAVTAQVRVRR